MGWYCCIWVDICVTDIPVKVLGASDPISGTVTMHELTKYAYAVVSEATRH